MLLASWPGQSGMGEQALNFIFGLTTVFFIELLDAPVSVKCPSVLPIRPSVGLLTVSGMLLDWVNRLRWRNHGFLVVGMRRGKPTGLPLFDYLSSSYKSSGDWAQPRPIMDAKACERVT